MRRTCWREQRETLVSLLEHVDRPPSMPRTEVKRFQCIDIISRTSLVVVSIALYLRKQSAATFCCPHCPVLWYYCNLQVDRRTVLAQSLTH